MAEFIRVDGLDGLDSALAELGSKLGFRALRSGLMNASKPMFLAAKVNASSTGIKGFDSGSTAAAMGRFTKKLDRRTTALFIGPKNRSKKGIAIWNREHGTNIDRLRHFHLLEFGSVNGPAQPFLRTAFDATKYLVVVRFGREIRRSLDKVRRRNAR